MNDVQETKRTEALFERISALIEQSRQFVASSVNVAGGQNIIDAVWRQQC